MKSPQPRFHWSENQSESQEQASRRRSESMRKHGWEGQTIDKGKPVAVPPEPRPLRFWRARRRKRRQKLVVASPDLHIMQESWGPH